MPLLYASAPPLPTVEEIMDVDANKKKRNAAKVNPAEAYSNGMAYMAIGMGVRTSHCQAEEAAGGALMDATVQVDSGPAACIGEGPDAHHTCWCDSAAT